jgi:hypothetical protein
MVCAKERAASSSDLCILQIAPPACPRATSFVLPSCVITVDHAAALYHWFHCCCCAPSRLNCLSSATAPVMTTFLDAPLLFRKHFDLKHLRLLQFGFKDERNYFALDNRS